MKIRFMDEYATKRTITSDGSKIGFKMAGKHYNRDRWVDEDGNTWVYFGGQMNKLNDGVLGENLECSTRVWEGSEIIRKYKSRYSNDYWPLHW